jgi:hypothetical protein
MVKLFKDKEREDRIGPLLVLKRTIKEGKPTRDAIESAPLEVKEKINGMFDKLFDLDKKIENMEEEVVKMKGLLAKAYNLREDSVKKIKIKESVRSLLEKHGKLNSVQLSKLINLSRTRCNEYFKEMEKEGIARGITKNRQRFYEICD